MKKASSPLLTPFSLTVFCLSACVSSCETIPAEKNSVSLSNRCVVDNASTPLSQNGNPYFIFIFIFIPLFPTNPSCALPFLPPSTHIQVHFLPSLVRKLLGPLFRLDRCRRFPANKPHPLLPAGPRSSQQLLPVLSAQPATRLALFRSKKKTNSLFVTGFSLRGIAPGFKKLVLLGPRADVCLFFLFFCFSARE